MHLDSIFARNYYLIDLVDQHELFTEAIKYYANILTPFSHLVTKKIDEVVKLSLPIDFICPSHGVVWRDNPLQIVKNTRSGQQIIRKSDNSYL